MNMDEVKKSKPVKEKKKRSQGSKKERKHEEPQQQSGAPFFSQAQQLHQQEGLMLGDSHSSFVGRMTTQHLSSSSPFTTTQHGSIVTSAPSHSALRTPTSLPPKKSISPSRMAALTEQQGQIQRHLALGLGQGRPWQYQFTGVPAGFQGQGQGSTANTASELAAHLTGKHHPVNVSRPEDLEQGGLLRQQLLQQRMTLPMDPLNQSERKFSPYQQSTGGLDRGSERQSPQTVPIKYQREDISRTIAPPNVQVPTFGSKTETGRILGGHHSKALGLEEKINFPQQHFDSGPGPGKIQLQRIVIPTSREDVRRAVSPAKRESQPQPAHLGEQTPYHVSTIQRTPSPAHVERRSPVPSYGKQQEQPEKTQPVNLSIPELHKKQGGGVHKKQAGGGQAGITGAVLSTLYAIQNQAKAGAPGHVVYHPPRTEQQDYTIKAPELNFHKLSRPEGGSISIPSQILNTVQSGGQLQSEILRQTLLQGVSNAQMHSANQALHATQHGSRVIKEEPKPHEQGPIMYKFEADGSRRTVSPTPGRRGPSPHQHHHAALSGSIELKRASPVPGTVSHLASGSQIPSSTAAQQPMRYIIPANISPKMSTGGSMDGVPAEGFRHKVPSPKPQHRHKEQLAALHQTYAAKGASHQTSVPSSLQTSHVSSVPPPHLSSAMLPTTVPPNVNIPHNTGQIRQPVVSLVRLPDNHPGKEDKRAPSPYSVIQMSQETRVMADVSRPEKTSVADVFGSAKKPEQPQKQTVHHKQVNPFTFPPKAHAKLFPYHQFPVDSKDEFPVGGQKRVNPTPREPMIADGADDMPKLLPVSPVNSREHDGSRRKEDKAGDMEELTPIPNPFNMRLQNLANLPTTSIYRSSYRAHSVAVQRAKSGCIVSAAKSLDLLRQNLQRFINKEIDVIIQQYVEKFFKPGMENIKENSGSVAVSEEHLQAVCRQMLEEAKKMYLSDQGRCSVTPTRDIPDNVSENGSTGSRSRVPFGRKRKQSDTDSEKSHAVPRRKKGRPPLVSGRSTPSKLKSSDPVKREGPKWDQERITLNSLFIMGARANKALGLGATRGRIYIKHPDLFKFSGDQDDKQWLYENHHMPATGGKAYMLLLEDVKELAEDDEYRDNGNQMPQELIGFTIPEWMLEKVKAQMMAGRTDSGKKMGRSRSTTPNEIPASSLQDEDEELKHLPFSSFSSRKIKDEMQNSPSGDTEMEFLSGADNDDQAFTRMSPFTLTGGFDEPSPSPSDLDTLEDETPLSAPFDLTN
ncbi:uncharacterized protein [Argopecten irradians]|uniref:uncharacterized protein isoform X2 n=1 Tax=Argopecten irradians TaxID=31199 RepID=UPI00371C3917